jgi:hypothetical protein
MRALFEMHQALSMRKRSLESFSKDVLVAVLKAHFSLGYGLISQSEFMRLCEAWETDIKEDRAWKTMMHTLDDLLAEKGISDRQFKRLCRRHDRAKARYDKAKSRAEAKRRRPESTSGQPQPAGSATI